ncbi:Striatin-interacting protein 1 [Orchesella cincta]|uniref:Striatin-interacting protein 1 n=1 Tax=Orchesella cincta TaxID=48709 RepID=A0A1D2NDT7_ORCCI|nr:Striatin-interacting protein 1 [Orchesella cincta]
MDGDSINSPDRNGISKIRDLIRRQRQESDGGCDESSELDFLYDDADNYTNEISELYSYTEVPEFRKNLAAYDAVMERWGIPLQWQRLSPEVRKSVILRLLNHFELSSKTLRAEAARAILYVAQGCWSEVQSEQEQQQWTRYNVTLLLKNGIFQAVVDLLCLEIESGPMAVRKPAVSLADSAELRVIFSILYTIVETIRTKSDDDTEEFEEQRKAFKAEIAQPVRDELLAVKLLNMVIKFCGGSAPHFPIKKVLLLLWKVVLFSLGGTCELRELKTKYRELAGLAPMKEDTLEVSRNMRAASPPASATDLLDAQNERRNIRPLRRSLMKQTSLDESAALDLEMGDQMEEEMKEIEERRAMEESGELPQPPSPRPMTPVPAKNKGLPWTPKVRQKDLDAFLENSRMKFVGFPIQGDRDTLAGLPAPIHEGVKVLKQHIYVSLSEWQMTREEELWRCPLSMKESDTDSPAHGVEALYAAMLPNLPQYIIALLKILLAAAPTSKSKSESINIMADVLPEEMPMTVVQSMKLGIDVARHKEIIVKSISAIILLLLKHTKINHVYQFEFISQHLVFANCIPLVLKFFNQNITAYITAKNTIALADFPSCVLGEPPELTPESLELGEPQVYCWRNLFACINLLRILNKLTKWKHSRIMMLVVFKSAPILKRSLRVKQPLLQLYILKLLKMQTKYLGRQWRKANMKTMSAIYQKVRHRLTDDWAYGNDLDARPWDFQAEECALRAAVDRFNSRRYGEPSKILPDFEPVDHCITSVLGRPVHLTNTFREYYEVWLEQEVFKNPVNWDEVLSCPGYF